MTPSRGSRSRSRSSSKERLLSKLADAAAVVDTPVDEDEIKGEYPSLISVISCLPLPFSLLPSLLHISIVVSLIGRMRLESRKSPHYVR